MISTCHIIEAVISDVSRLRMRLQRPHITPLSPPATSGCQYPETRAGVTTNMNIGDHVTATT